MYKKYIIRFRERLDNSKVLASIYTGGENIKKINDTNMNIALAISKLAREETNKVYLIIPNITKRDLLLELAFQKIKKQLSLFFDLTAVTHEYEDALELSIKQSPYGLILSMQDNEIRDVYFSEKEDYLKKEILIIKEKVNVAEYCLTKREVALLAAGLLKYIAVVGKFRKAKVIADFLMSSIKKLWDKKIAKIYTCTNREFINTLGKVQYITYTEDLFLKKKSGLEFFITSKKVSDNSEVILLSIVNSNYQKTTAEKYLIEEKSAILEVVPNIKEDEELFIKNIQDNGQRIIVSRKKEFDLVTILDAIEADGQGGLTSYLPIMLKVDCKSQLAKDAAKKLLNIFEVFKDCNLRKRVLDINDKVFESTLWLINPLANDLSNVRYIKTLMIELIDINKEVYTISLQGAYSLKKICLEIKRSETEDICENIICPLTLRYDSFVLRHSTDSKYEADKIMHIVHEYLIERDMHVQCHREIAIRG